jgi:hypothetical protein
MDDLENIIEIGTKLLEKSNNHDVPVDRHTVFSVVREFVRAPDKTILLAEHDGQITGFIMLAAETFWWAHPKKGRRYVTDFAFFSQRHGDGLKMLDIATEWAWKLPRVVEVSIARNFTNAEKSADVVFALCGFERAGAMYTIKKPEVEP